MFMYSMTCDLGDEVNALRDMFHAWAQERVKPMAQEIDETNDFPNALWREMGELGLLGITVHDDYGGASSGVATLITFPPIHDRYRTSAGLLKRLG